MKAIDDEPRLQDGQGRRAGIHVGCGAGCLPRAGAQGRAAGLCGSVPEWNPETPLNPQPQPIPEPKVNPALATSE